MNMIYSVTEGRENILVVETGVVYTFIPEDWAPGISNVTCPSLRVYAGSADGYSHSYYGDEAVDVFRQLKALVAKEDSGMKKIMGLKKDAILKHFQNYSLEELQLVHLKDEDITKVRGASLIYLAMDGRYKILKNNFGKTGIVDKQFLDEEIAKAKGGNHALPSVA